MNGLLSTLGFILLILFLLTLCSPESVGRMGAKVQQGYSNQMEIDDER